MGWLLLGAAMLASLILSTCWFVWWSLVGDPFEIKFPDDDPFREDETPSS